MSKICETEEEKCTLSWRKKKEVVNKQLNNEIFLVVVGLEEDWGDPKNEGLYYLGIAS